MGACSWIAGWLRGVCPGLRMPPAMPQGPAGTAAACQHSAYHVRVAFHSAAGHRRACSSQQPPPHDSVHWLAAAPQAAQLAAHPSEATHCLPRPAPPLPARAQGSHRSCMRFPAKQQTPLELGSKGPCNPHALRPAPAAATRWYGAGAPAGAASAMRWQPCCVPRGQPARSAAGGATLEALRRRRQRCCPLLRRTPAA